MPIGRSRNAEAKYFTASETARWERVETNGAKGVSRQYLVGRGRGTAKFYLRKYLVEPGGNTSLDNHNYEHIVYVLSGRARVRIDEETRLVKEGMTIYIPANVTHQFFNASRTADDDLVFLCVKGDESLYE